MNQPAFLKDSVFVLLIRAYGSLCTLPLTHARSVDRSSAKYQVFSAHKSHVLLRLRLKEMLHSTLRFFSQPWIYNEALM